MISSQRTMQAKMTISRTALVGLLALGTATSASAQSRPNFQPSPPPHLAEEPKRVRSRRKPGFACVKPDPLRPRSTRKRCPAGIFGQIETIRSSQQCRDARRLFGLVAENLRPQHGTVRVFGLDPQKNEVAVKSRLAYVPDAVAFYPWMTVRDTLNYLASFRVNWNRDIENDLLKRFQLDPGQKASHLSKGQRTQLAVGETPAGPPIAYVRQKKLAIKEQIRFYGDEGETQELFHIQAQTWLDTGGSRRV